MSSPHVAGAAILLRRPAPGLDAGPDQVRADDHRHHRRASRRTASRRPTRSTSARAASTSTQAGDPGLTFDETADNFVALGADPVNAVDLNLPSINAPVMPGALTTTRDGEERQRPAAAATAFDDQRTQARDDDHGRAARVSRRAGRVDDVRRSRSRSTNRRRRSTSVDRATPKPQRQPVPRAPAGGLRAAAGRRRADAELRADDDPPSPRHAPRARSTATNNTSHGHDRRPARRRVDERLRITRSSSGATRAARHGVERTSVPLAGAHAGRPRRSRPGRRPAGYLPLDDFGVTPIPIGDEDILNFNVPPFVYNGDRRTTAIGVDSNGYLVVGGGDAEDNNCCTAAGAAEPGRAEQRAGAVLDRSRRHRRAGHLRRRRSTDGVEHLDRRRVAGQRVRHDRPAGTSRCGSAINGVAGHLLRLRPGANLPTPTGSAEPLVVGAENDDGPQRRATSGRTCLPTAGPAGTSAPGVAR